MQPVLAFGVETADPFVRALATDPHRLGHMGDGYPFIADTTDKQTTTPERQPGITVRHEDLRDR